MCQKKLVFGFGDILIGSGTVTAISGEKAPAVSFIPHPGHYQAGDSLKEDSEELLKKQLPPDVIFIFPNKEGLDAVISSLITFKNLNFPDE